MIINNIEHINIRTKDEPFYVPKMTEELKQWYIDNKDVILNIHKL